MSWVGHTVEINTFKLLLHPRLSYGRDSLAGPGVAWALFLFLLHSLWLSTQTVTRWLLGTEKMALKSTRFLQVSEGEWMERRSLLPHSFPQMSVFHALFHFLGSQGAQHQEQNVAVSALVWLSPSVLVSGAEDGSLHGWMLKGNALHSLWLLSRYQKPVLGLAASQELLAAASGTTEQVMESLLWNMPVSPFNL